MNILVNKEGTGRLKEWASLLHTKRIIEKPTLAALVHYSLRLLWEQTRSLQGDSNEQCPV